MDYEESLFAAFQVLEIEECEGEGSEEDHQKRAKDRQKTLEEKESDSSAANISCREEVCSSPEPNHNLTEIMNAELCF